MHLIVSNIPNEFRSCDLRNFFSEFIEKEAFNCFHFRHRPQSQLLDIIKRSSLGEHRSAEVCGGDGEARDSNDSKALRANSNEVDVGDEDCCKVTTNNDSTLLHTDTEGCDKTDNLKTMGTQNAIISSEAKARRECTSDRDASDGGETGDGGGGGGSLSGHWVSSGLAGLASIISEKKQRAKPSREPEKEKQCPAELPQAEELTGVSGDVGRTCCVVDVKDGLEETFFNRYNHKHWVTRAGDILPQRCYLLRVDFQNQNKANAADGDYRTRQELSALSLEPGAPRDLIEFQPPPLMPQGNVGTSTRHFRELIRTCQMPGILIKKLGLEFSRGRRKRRFGQVPFDYGTSVSSSQEDTQGERDIVFTAAGHLVPNSADFEKEMKKRRRRKKDKGMLRRGPKMELEEEAEDGAEVEEWERYEPFHEDVTSQERTQERRFEKELEVVWEKGGSGLVFYTDTQFWRAQEGDFDEQTTDEWDVDMSVYYEEGSGDKDARDGLDMTTSNKLRAGSLHQSAFKRKEKGEQDKRPTSSSSLLTAKRGRGGQKRRIIGPTPPPSIGRFEAHTKGIGRRLMEAQGWQEGQGLGVGSAGMPYALENEGQHPHERKGFGYHGEKLQAWASSTTSAAPTKPNPKPNPHRHHRISTVFDRAEDADPPPPHNRRPEPTVLTHRSNPR